MNKPILSALAVALSAAASAQCFNPESNFNGPVYSSVPVNSLDGWTYTGPLFAAATIQTNPFDLPQSTPAVDRQAILFPVVGGIVQRDLGSALGGEVIGSEFTISFDITVARSGYFAIRCAGSPNIRRARVDFDFSGPPQVVYTSSGPSPQTFTAPLTPNTPTELRLEVNTNGGVAIFWDGAMMGMEADSWAFASPSCPEPSVAEWFTSPGTGSIGTYVDNVCIVQEVATACGEFKNSTGLPSRIAVSGSRSLAANDLTLTANNIPNGSVGALLVGTRARAGLIPPLAGYEGRICIDGFTVSPGVLSAGTSGMLSSDVNWLMLPHTQSVAMAGESWHFQFYYRDVNPAGQLVANFSGRASIVVLP